MLGEFDSSEVIIVAPILLEVMKPNKQCEAKEPVLNQDGGTELPHNNERVQTFDNDLRPR